MQDVSSYFSQRTSPGLFESLAVLEDAVSRFCPKSYFPCTIFGISRIPVCIDSLNSI